ncbi:MAG: hypothetical protein BLITH_0305 [Brockia lithotrophica]|uniref:Uncharacterized protein n=1 Tax=Brockia lithotrophica TaxID=933949 RepID=A0A2T5GAL4_9BACL|nr:MAG: hypothetical protein BLITH_0305 [Brockia lithotrophica]
MSVPGYILPPRASERIPNPFSWSQYQNKEQESSDFQRMFTPLLLRRTRRTEEQDEN